MSDVANILKTIKDKEIAYVDLRFTDTRGKWQHVAMDADLIDEDTFTDGVMFDGSSIAGWKSIDKSDMTLMLDPSTAVMDPFAAQSSMIIICDILEPETGEPYERDPRSIAKKAEAYMTHTGIGDTAVFGPEAEFFIFDDVKFGVSQTRTFYEIDERELPANWGKHYAEGNLGHRPGPKGGYFPVPPIDSHSDIRAEMLTTIKEMGVVVEKHHHEVAPAQDELGIKFGTLTKIADGMQIYKYCRPQRRPFLWQVGDFHAEADVERQRLGHARSPVDLEGRQADLRRQRLCRPVRHLPLLYRRHHQARQGDQRLHQLADQQLQAAGPGLRGAGTAGLFRHATVRPRAVFRSRRARRASASKSASRIRARTPIWPSPPC